MQSNASDQGKSAFLAELLDEFMEQYRQGTPISVDDFLREHPSHAADLRQLLAAAQALNAAEPSSPSVPTIRQDDSRPVAEKIADYRIIGEIGRGGMGVVYRAEQQSLGRCFALKVLPRSAAGRKDAQDRFLREARAAARLHHTNIIPVFEVGVDGDTYYYAMQYIDGRPLDDVFRALQQMLPVSNRRSTLDKEQDNQPPVQPVEQV
ncbi:MAG: protein kinase, partial [Planctomycetaceae bacterium]|nr:protein kinase [Planctomycetaceae bacterium]